MNGFNRFVLLVVALLLIAIPVLLLLINFGVIPADTINRYTGYRSGLASLQGITNLDLTSTAARVITVIVGALVALISLMLLLRELTFGKVLVRNAVIDGSPGAETRLTSKAISAISDGAAREAGARDPSTSLSTKKGAYEVDCRIKVQEGGNYTEIASRARSNIKRALEAQNLKVREVEVTVQGKE